MNSKLNFTNNSWKSFKRLLAARAGVLLLCFAAASGRAQTHTILHNFGTASGDGTNTWTGLVLSGGTLYGTTEHGGIYGYGTVFKINTNGSNYAVLRNFAAGSDSAIPMGDLVLSGTTLYGTTWWGGTNEGGTVFKIDTDGTGYTVLKVFSDPSDGRGPEAGLVMSGATLYGTTTYGGSGQPWAVGTVFKLNTDGSQYALLHSFSAALGSDPSAGMVMSGSSLYGTTCGWSTQDSDSTVFRINTDGSGFTVLARVGYLPMSTLVMSGETLYGTTVNGGGTTFGTLFKVNTDGSGYSVMRVFSSQNGDGAYPYGGLLLCGPRLYGTANGGGNGHGIIYMINTNGSGYYILKQFTGLDGSGPTATLTLGGTTLYGTTRYGGTADNGVVFSLSIAPPTVQTPPQSQTTEMGSTVDLDVHVTSSPAPTYQWFFNGTNAISGVTTNSHCKLTNAQSNNCGAYSVVVSNMFGAATSSPAMLSVIAPVGRRPAPAINLMGQAGNFTGLDYSDNPGPIANWETMATMTLSNASQYCFDVSAPLPPQRFYRAWQAGTPIVMPSLDLHLVPALTLTGSIGDSLRLDYINQVGPVDAWGTLDTVTLTNSSQLYFDTSSIGQPARLWRIVPVP